MKTNKLFFSASSYRQLTEQISALIDAEFAAFSDAEDAYAKMVLAYEFFRLLRGEAFTRFHEPDAALQRDLYQIEQKLLAKVLTIKNKLPADKTKVKFQLEQLISEGLRV